MRIDVRLAGYSTQWRMENTIEFEAWIDDGKWVEEGGLHLVRLPTSSYHGAFCSRLEQAMVSSAHHLGAQCVRIQYPDLIDTALSLEDAFLQSLGIHSEIKEYQKLLDASRLFENRPIALIVALFNFVEHRAILECQSFVDRIEKVGGRRRPTILGLVASDVAPLQPSFSMIRGVPENLILCDPDLEDRERWERYMHQRVAWEFGGALGLAERWNQELALEKIPTGHDGLFENRLNHAAGQLLQETDRDAVEFVLKSLCSDKPFDLSNWSHDASVEGSLFWWVDGPHRPTLCPWLARALLINQESPALCDHLRASLNCRPLASEMLYHCFAIEARERVRCCADMQDERNAPDLAIRAFNDFKAKRDNSFARFYPPDFPVKQWTVWQFAAFGEVLSYTRVPSDRIHRECQYSIKQLRNALAHGHYPAWQMLSEVVEVLRLIR